MLLMDAIKVMAQLVHEDVQESEGASLGFGEVAGGAVFARGRSDAQFIENFFVCLELDGHQGDPKVLGPRIEVDGPRFFLVIEGMVAIG